LWLFGSEHKKTLSPFFTLTKDLLGRHLFLNVLNALFVLAVILAGCKKSELAPLSSAGIHAITQQLAAAAASAAPGSEIRTRKAASDQQASSVDEINIRYSGEPAVLARIWRSLDGVATRNRLTQDPPTPVDDGYILILRHSGAPTHRIQIGVIPRPATSKFSGKPETSAEPRLAIILDDLGSDRGAAEVVFSLHYPLTLSVLPNHEHSVDIAEEAHRRGYQVMLHLPMQSVGKEQPESQELRPGMNAQEVAGMLDQFLKEVPAVAGVNNHQGSQATADPALMSELMPALRDRNLFYVDSRTTAETVAFDTAQKNGVRSGFRNVPFLDDVAETAAVRKQLELALKGAREKGEAIAIGHPHPATLQALREILPQAEAQGVHLVFVSELVH
jgi:uncharacterized protein